MIQCKDCEYYQRDEQGAMAFKCDPFGTIIEPECLAKWQLIKINQMVASYQATLAFYQKMAPMQEKMFRVIEREVEDLDESEKWKTTEDDEDAEGNDDLWSPADE